MAAISFEVNGRRQQVDVSANTPILWVLRDTLGMTGTKFGCGAGLCGACTVILDGAAVRSCSTPISRAANRAITTIEGLATNGALHPVQQAWVEEDVPQCGYCQPGMIMTTVSLIAKNPKPTDTEINQALGGHICRCGTYQRIRAAIHRVAGNAVRPVNRDKAGAL
jgi:aerobic-type carbon monoxide dehydrogenase small subunit (CoxS/CutS family)